MRCNSFQTKFCSIRVVMHVQTVHKLSSVLIFWNIFPTIKPGYMAHVLNLKGYIRAYVSLARAHWSSWEKNSKLSFRWTERHEREYSLQRETTIDSMQSLSASLRGGSFTPRTGLYKLSHRKASSFVYGWLKFDLTHFFQFSEDELSLVSFEDS